MSSLMRQCGTWQDSYTQFHKETLNKRIKGRFLVSLSLSKNDNQKGHGLADNINGIISAFLYALITKRVLLIWYTGGLSLSNVLKSPNINVFTQKSLYYPSMNISFATCHLNHHLYDGIYNVTNARKDCARRHPFVANPLSYIAYDFFNNDRRSIDQLFGKMDLSKNPYDNIPDPKTIYFRTNRARTVMIFDNPHHNQTLREMGLTPHNAYGCLYSYLFRVKPHVCGSNCQNFKKILTDAGEKGIVRVGVHIRHVDRVFNRTSILYNRINISETNNYFRCAKDIVTSKQITIKKKYFYFWTKYIKLPVRYLIYFVTDNLKLRKVVKEFYKDGVLVDTSRVIGHS
eukprot:gene10793-22530_t